MSDIILSILAGAIQGLTEFLPISSSGHLVLFHEIFNFNFPDKIAFDVVLHLGTLLALLLFFYKDIITLLVAWLGSFKRWDITNNTDQRLSWLLILGTIPAGLAGFFLEDIIENVFRNMVSVGAMLIFFGVLLYLADKFSAKKIEIKELKTLDVLIVGVAQVLALIPGVSRSGITIIAGLSRNLKRDQAAKFSFLLSIPIIAAAGLKKMADLILAGGVAFADYPVLIAGFISSVVVGYFCIKYFLKFVQKHSLAVFAVYRVVLGLLVIGWYFL
jgi:undecaprenyl-diphosphatase